MWYVRFSSKALNICFGKTLGFDCKINYEWNKLANFWLDIISKINSKILVIILYILSGLRLKKVY